jgi:probable HAF family extracellular repeat protein
MGSGFKALMAALGIGASLAAHAIAAQWTVVDITPEGPGYATAISAAGVVVGCRLVGTETRAFVYANGSRRDLAVPEGSTSCATAVSDSGLVAGRIDGEITLWENGAARALGAKGNVTGIADNGVLVGAMEDGTTNSFGAANRRAFLWSNGVFTDLGAPSGNTTAVGINRRGQVAVIADGKLFMYENGVLRDLGATVGTASGFNDRGEIVGMTSFGHGPEPYIYDGVVRQIPGAYSYAGAVALNNMGQVLGSGEGVYGFLMEAGQVARIDALLGAPWGHSEPSAINDRGWIAGHGGTSSDFHAFVAMPKETVAPSSSRNGNPLMRYAPKSRPLLMQRSRTSL